MKVLVVWFSVILSCGISVINASDCPAGYTTNSQLCTQISPCCVPINDSIRDLQEVIRGNEAIVCSAGFVAQNGRCIKLESNISPVITSCPIGTIPNNNGVCVQIANQGCPSGYIRGSSGQCVQGCPSGFVPGSSGQCVQGCPSGYISGSSGQCVQGCPSGFVTGSSGQCVQGCPSGFVPGSSGQCVQVVTQPQIIQPNVCPFTQQPSLCQQSVAQGCAQQQPIYQPQPIYPSIQPTPCQPTPVYPPIAPLVIPPITTTPPPIKPRPTAPVPVPRQEVDTTVIYVTAAPQITERIETFTNAPDETNISLTLTNVIHTNNTIHVPVNVTNYNVVNTPVYISETEQIKNEVQPQPAEPQPRPAEPRQTKCCSVISPRICRPDNNQNWNCHHKRYHRCGSFCTAPKIYLRQRPMQYRDSRLFVPPLRTQSHYVNRESLDCSGCMSRRSQGCSQGCHTYNCNRSRGCQYQDQGEFCSEYGGEGCSEEDGYDEQYNQPNDYYEVPY